MTRAGFSGVKTAPLLYARDLACSDEAKTGIGLGGVAGLAAWLLMAM